MDSQALFTRHCLDFWTMKPSLPERLGQIKFELGLDEDAQLVKLSGASKSIVHQWLNGKIKSISAKYAYKLEEQTGFSAKWIQLGEGPPRISKAIMQTMESMKAMCPEQQYLVARLADQVAEPSKQETPSQ